MPGSDTSCRRHGPQQVVATTVRLVPGSTEGSVDVLSCVRELALRSRPLWQASGKAAGSVTIWAGRPLWQELLAAIDAQATRDSWLEPDEVSDTEATFPVEIDDGWLRVFAEVSDDLPGDVLMLDTGEGSPSDLMLTPEPDGDDGTAPRLRFLPQATDLREPVPLAVYRRLRSAGIEAADASAMTLATLSGETGAVGAEAAAGSTSEPSPAVPGLSWPSVGPAARRAAAIEASVASVPRLGVPDLLPLLDRLPETRLGTVVRRLSGGWSESFVELLLAGVDLLEVDDTELLELQRDLQLLTAEHERGRELLGTAARPDWARRLTFADAVHALDRCREQRAACRGCGTRSGPWELHVRRAGPPPEFVERWCADCAPHYRTPLPV